MHCKLSGIKQSEQLRAVDNNYHLYHLLKTLSHIQHYQNIV